MRHLMSRLLLAASLSLALAGCNTAGMSLSGSFAPKDLSLEDDGASAFASASPREAGEPFGEPTPQGALVGARPGDDLSTGKAYFRAANYGMAEKYFRRAVEQHPTDAEAWLDLAAAYDHLKRFDLADRAYAEAIKLAGHKVEILNNQGYSYMLRGDNARAHQKLTEALRREPGNRYALSNLRLLQESAARSKAVE